MDTREATRNYRLNQWTEIVRECRSSGQTVAVWCAENSIIPRNYYYWLKKVRTAACEVLPSLQTENNSIVPVSFPLNHARVGKGLRSSSSGVVFSSPCDCQEKSEPVARKKVSH